MLNPRQTSIWTHPSVWGPTLLLVGLYVLLGACGWTPFHTRDDADIVGLLTGAHGVAPTGFTLMLSPWYGSGLAFLYQRWPAGHWYDLALLACYVLSFGWIVASMRRNGWAPASIFLAAAALVMGFLLWQPGFTLAAQFLTAAAVAPLVTQRPSQPLRRLSHGEVVASVVLILLGTAYRVEAAGLSLCVAAAGFAILRVSEIVGRRRQAWRSVMVLVLLFGVVLVSRATSATLPASAEAARWRQYNARRAAIQDYGRAGSDAAWQNSLGLSLNDLAMLTHSMSMDSGPFALERLKMIPLDAPRQTPAEVVSALVASMGSQAIIVLAAVALGCLFRPRLLLVVASTLLILCLVQWQYHRLLPRVLLPPLGILAMMCVGAVEPQRKPARWFCRLAALGLLLCSCTLATQSLRDRVAVIRDRARDESAVRDFCQAHGVDRLLFWNGRAGSLLLFRDPAACAAISCDLGGWEGSHPARLAASREILGEDLFLGACRPGTYHCLMGDRLKHPMLMAFFREHGLPGTRVETVFQSGAAVVYRVVSEDAATSWPAGREP